jgi:hypothetical protein
MPSTLWGPTIIRTKTYAKTQLPIRGFGIAKGLEVTSKQKPGLEGYAPIGQSPAPKPAALVT